MRCAWDVVTEDVTMEQLVEEVKGIYEGIVMVEKKSVELFEEQRKLLRPGNSIGLTDVQIQALALLQRTLCNEHHDFLLACHHSKASSPLQKLATKYAMPARMWCHGVHTFLEFLRRPLPATFEHIMSFIVMAFHEYTLLLESVPQLGIVWRECLGDVARYA